MEKNLPYYLESLRKLNRASHPKLGKAPHKPVLLLSVLQLVRDNVIDTNRIFVTPELVIAFKSNWELLVDSGHTATFALPFFHMRSEPFWRLLLTPGAGTTVSSISSFAALKRTVIFAEIDIELFRLMLDPEFGAVIENTLLDLYFPYTQKRYLEQNGYSIATEIEQEIVNEPPAEYQQRMLQLEHSGIDIEEERFIRNGIFKRQIPKIYGYRCCISGMKLEAGFNVQMVDACHIVPFSFSRNDTISNGISLAPNLHRAFDRGLITITADYRVRVSRAFKENATPFSLGQFENRMLLLPDAAREYPSAENLVWHNKERFVL